MSGRAALWVNLPAERHLTLIDDALDRNDSTHETIRREFQVAVGELKTDMKAGFAKCEEDSKGTRRLLIGLLVSIVASSAAVVFAVATFGAPT